VSIAEGVTDLLKDPAAPRVIDQIRRLLPGPWSYDPTGYGGTWRRPDGGYVTRVSTGYDEARDASSGYCWYYYPAEGTPQVLTIFEPRRRP